VLCVAEKRVLVELLREAEEQLAYLRAQAAELDRSERLASERVTHLRALVELDGVSAPATDSAAGTDGRGSVDLPDVRVRPRPNDAVVPPSAPSGRRPEDIAAEVLSERGPLHYRELWDEVAKRGGVIVSGNPAAVLLTRVSRDERFAKGRSRGMYRLVLGNAATRPPPRPRSRRRRRHGKKKEIFAVPN
jgi:hypothetical protein